MAGTKEPYPFSGGGKLIIRGPCDYYGFTVKTGGGLVTFRAYDSLEASGLLVEDFPCNDQQPTDGHEHSTPVRCKNGLYVQCSADGIVYALSQITGKAV